MKQASKSNLLRWKSTNPKRSALAFPIITLRWNNTLFFLLCFLFIGLTPLAAQKRESLEKKRNRLLGEIKTTTSLLQKATKNKSATLDRYVALRRQIENREALIETIQEEIALVDSNRVKTGEVINALENDLDRLEEEYGIMIRNAYRQKINQNALAFLFSSESFNQAFQRWQYLKKYSDYREKQVKLILETQKSLEEKIAQLELRRQEKEALLSEQEAQRDQLAVEMNDKSRLLETLKANESKLRRELNTQRVAHEKLNNAIENIIQSEVLASRKRARSREALSTPEKRKPNTQRTTPTPKTPETGALTTNFRSNRGRLPWPVEKGLITRYFGKQAHPTLRKIQITNNGIDIRTERNAAVRAVFAGEVVGKQYVPGYNHMLIIKHGDYYTVYSNLQEVFVRKNDRITTRQRIGTVSTNENNISEVHFEVWKDKTRLNPVKWILKR